MTAPKPVLVASDVHLGATDAEHERAFYAWLDHAAEAASWIVLNGDLFDFWFEYRRGVTAGYDEVLARLRRIVDGGVPVTLMGGNHDWWGGSYLRDEIGLEFLREPVVRDIAGRRALVAHGDGLDPDDRAYLALQAVIRSRLTRFGFGLLPAAVGDRIALLASKTDGRWDEWGEAEQARSDGLEAWALDTLRNRPELELVLLGHTHLPLVREAAPGRWYANSGDWVRHRSWIRLEQDRPPRVCNWGEDAP